MPIPYVIVARGTPCVTPSLLCRKLAIIFPFRKTSDDQRQYQLKTKRYPDGHKCWTVHSIPTQLISLKALLSSTNKTPQFSVVYFSSQIAWSAWTAPSITTLGPEQSWSPWHVIVASGPVTLKKILTKICLHVSLTLPRHTVGCLSIAIRRQAINAW